jgi:hypothetical protein
LDVASNKKSNITPLMSLRKSGNSTGAGTSINARTPLLVPTPSTDDGHSRRINSDNSPSSSLGDRGRINNISSTSIDSRHSQRDDDLKSEMDDDATAPPPQKCWRVGLPMGLLLVVSDIVLSSTLHAKIPVDFEHFFSWELGSNLERFHFDRSTVDVWFAACARFLVLSIALYTLWRRRTGATEFDKVVSYYNHHRSRCVKYMMNE